MVNLQSSCWSTTRVVSATNLCGCICWGNIYEKLAGSEPASWFPSSNRLFSPSSVASTQFGQTSIQWRYQSQNVRPVQFIRSGRHHAAIRTYLQLSTTQPCAIHGEVRVGVPVIKMTRHSISDRSSHHTTGTGLIASSWVRDPTASIVLNLCSWKPRRSHSLKEDYEKLNRWTIPPLAVKLLENSHWSTKVVRSPCCLYQKQANQPLLDSDYHKLWFMLKLTKS